MEKIAVAAFCAQLIVAQDILVLHLVTDAFYSNNSASRLDHRPLPLVLLSNLQPRVNP